MIPETKVETDTGKKMIEDNIVKDKKVSEIAAMDEGDKTSDIISKNQVIEGILIPELVETGNAKKSDSVLKVKKSSEQIVEDKKQAELVKTDTTVKSEAIKKVENTSEPIVERKIQAEPVKSNSTVKSGAIEKAEKTIVENKVQAKLVKIDPTPESKAFQKPSEQIVQEKTHPEHEKYEKIADLNVTPNLMDESIISVFESPPPSISLKDSTFSPVVDTSINDSRPNIDDLNLTPSAPSRVTLRTSTPLVQRVLKSGGVGTPKRINTPKIALPMSSLAKTPKLAERFASEEISDVPSKPNLLEKSILKSSRRKRSKSVADMEAGPKRVMFISPQIMEIDTIDERMMQSFMEERENSMMKPSMTPGLVKTGTSAGSALRKRSLSTGTPIKSVERPARLRKMPDFKAIHQQQFDRMESIADHQARKNERAKKLATPEPIKTKQTPEIIKTKQTPEAKKPKQQQPSKIPTVAIRKPLFNTASTDNVPKSRLLKRSQSAYEEEPAKKRIQLQAPSTIAFAGPSSSTPSNSNQKKIAVVSGLQRTKSESVATWTAPPTSIASFLGAKKPAFSSVCSSQINRSKIEERREKNMSMYKTNKIQRTIADQRQKNGNILKGVRLNRRFDLLMKSRRDQQEEIELSKKS